MCSRQVINVARSDDRTCSFQLRPLGVPSLFRLASPARHAPRVEERGGTKRRACPLGSDGDDRLTCGHSSLGGWRDDGEEEARIRSLEGEREPPAPRRQLNDHYEGSGGGDIIV